MKTGTSHMPDKLKDFVRETLDELFKRMPPEERLKGLSPEERLKGLSVDELISAAAGDPGSTDPKA
jgi:hypothetical protein